MLTVTEHVLPEGTLGLFLFIIGLLSAAAVLTFFKKDKSDPDQ